MEVLTVCEGIHSNGWVRGRRLELAQDPFKGAAPVMENAVVQFKEVGFFLVKEMEFGEDEAVEVAEHKECWWLLG